MVVKGQAIRGEVYYIKQYLACNLLLAASTITSTSSPTANLYTSSKYTVNATDTLLPIIYLSYANIN